jgi:AcrR family transcriptional regulator
MGSAQGDVTTTGAGASAESRREQKKARTRAALIAVSQRRFAEDGYHQTTLEGISEEVGVRPQTLLRYFESKAHLALAPWTEQLALVRHLLTDPRRRAGTVSVWRELVLHEAAEALAPSSPMAGNMVSNHAAFTAWADKDPFLVAMNSDLERQTQAVLARALAADQGLDADDLHSTLVAAMLVVGRRAVYERWSTAGDASPSLVADQLAVIDYAVTALASRPKALEGRPEKC